jgi:hypothetical protein
MRYQRPLFETEDFRDGVEEEGKILRKIARY